MYKIPCLVILLLVLGFSAQIQVVTFDNNWGENPLFNLVTESPNGVEVVFSVHEMMIEERLIDDEPMKTLCVPGIFLFNDEGAPNLAGTGRYVAIPQGAQAKITILDFRTEVYHDIKVAPAPNIPLDNDDSPLRYVKNMEIYSRNAFYPEKLVKLSEPFEMRGVDIVMLGITPFQYNPVTRELIVYKDIRLRVDFIGGNGHFGEDRLRSRFWEPILQAHLLNYNSLRNIDFYGPNGEEDPYGYEYVIIVPDDPTFEAWGDTIKAWRTSQGICSEVFTLSEIGGSDVEAIESFLNYAYWYWDIPPVAFLLLGDYPEITSPFWNGYCVSDNIYADVDEDDLPDMHHARICAHTDEQLSIMVNKLLNYERNPYSAPNFYNNPLVAVAWQTERWFQLCGEVIRGFFINGLGKNPTRQYAIYSNWNPPTPGCEWSTATNTPIVVNYWSGLGYIPTTNPYDASWWNNGSSSGITNAINSGAFLVQHRDHGSVTGWGEPPYHNEDLDDLTNTRFPFVYSTNCLTGMYNSSQECFAEKFQRIEYGALGVNAASQVSYSFVNDTYVWGTYDGLWPQFDPGYGVAGPEMLQPCMAMTYGKYYLEASSWPYNTQHKVYTYHLFHHHGDAFTTLYTEIPQYLTINHAPTLLESLTYFTVTANEGSIIALTVNNEIIGVGEGTGSPVTITISPQISGNVMKVTVTKANYYRYEADVPIVSPILEVCISGPSELGYKEIGTFVASVTGGSGSFNYEWFVKLDSGNGEWNPLSTNNDTITVRNGTLYGFHIRVDVTDNVTHEFCSDTMYVRGEFSGGGEYMIVITSPNGGERWGIGGTYSITWDDDVGDPHRMRYVILLSTDNGYSYDYTIATVFEWKGTHTYRWTIPRTMPPSSQCRIKIRGNGGGESAFDESDNNFTIIPGVEIINPNAQGDEYTLLPTEFQLSSSPNPFSTSTTIRYALPKDSKALIEVFSVTGRKIVTLVDGHHLAGYYSVIWDKKDELGKDATNGIYFLRLRTDDKTMTQKMLVLY